ncbi:3-ketoacyl-CoA synthase 7-like [Prosopis cineraria]|uniref:3-ketoacyl-CoA synthase 7-like n=1 Tax=Prosopis cineraria TaxID=364024 RepID=UPI00240EA731|nr:3-ketoacyl-CoA synthase 7-like [Prosopis cineraria]
MDALLSEFSSLSSNLSALLQGSVSLTLTLPAMFVLIIVLCCLRLWSRNVYLLDFVCFLPPNNLRIPPSNFIEHSEICDFSREAIDFESKVFERSGIGPEACMPDSVHEIPPTDSLKHAQEEIELVLFTIVQDLLTKHKVHPKNIDILVSNCSLFCPTPSLTSMIINKFGLRSNIKSVSLSGMGCSAGMLSISLAKDLLRVHKNSLALVLSMEVVAPNGYRGTAKSKLIPNVLFRMGGAAILLSNRKQDKKMAKYELKHLVRTHLGSNDNAYKCVYQEPDEAGHVGVSLSRTLLQVAALALRTNITTLGPLVLPYSEQIRFLWSAIRRRIQQGSNQKGTYVPNFRKSFEHFCIHAGGKGVIDAIEESLKLRKEDGEASRMALYRFGNTSSSSIWYELCYLEAKGRVKKGDRVWQIAFGSGFKCNSAVWECVSDIDPTVKNAWSDMIHLYPLEIPEFDY